MKKLIALILPLLLLSCSSGPKTYPTFPIKPDNLFVYLNSLSTAESFEIDNASIFGKKWIKLKILKKTVKDLKNGKQFLIASAKLPAGTYAFFKINGKTLTIDPPLNLKKSDVKALFLLFKNYKLAISKQKLSSVERKHFFVLPSLRAVAVYDEDRRQIAGFIGTGFVPGGVYSDGKNTLVCSIDGRLIKVFDYTFGQLKNAVPLGGITSCQKMVGQGEIAYILDPVGAQVLSFSADSLSVLGSSQFSSSPSDITISGGYVLVSVPEEGNVYVLNYSGEPMRAIQTSGEPVSAVLNSGYLFIADSFMPALIRQDSSQKVEPLNCQPNKLYSLGDYVYLATDCGLSVWDGKNFSKVVDFDLPMLKTMSSSFDGSELYAVGRKITIIDTSSLNKIGSVQLPAVATGGR